MGALTYLFGKLSNAVICHKISGLVRMTSFLKCLCGVCACNFYENGSSTGMVFEIFGRIVDCAVEILDMSTRKVHKKEGMQRMKRTFVAEDHPDNTPLGVQLHLCHGICGRHI